MRRTLVTGAVAALALVSLAAPASADHVTFTTMDGTACSTGPLASGTGQYLETDKVTSRTDKAGVTRFTCSFSGVAASSEDENGYFDWAPPSKALRITYSSTCVEYDGDDISAIGDADVRYRPNGKVTIDCTLEPVGS